MCSNHNISTNTSSRGAVLFFIEGCIFLILDLVAFMGNSLVCLAIYRNSSLRTVTNFFLFSLALTDLVAAIAVIPFNTISSFANCWVFGYLGCQLVGGFAYCWAGISLLTLTLVALNRYTCVVRPSIYTKTFSKKRAKVMIIVTWFFTSIVVAIVFPLLGIRFKVTRENPAIVSPLFSSQSSFTLFHAIHIVYIALPCLVMTACYFKVFLTIKKHNKSVIPSFQTGQAFFIRRRNPMTVIDCRNHGIEEARMTKLLAIVLAGFFLCWLPSFLTILLRLFHAIEKVHEVYSNFYHLFPAYLSSSINPVIYATMSKQFRLEFLNILRFKKKNSLFIDVS